MMVKRPILISHVLQWLVHSVAIRPNRAWRMQFSLEWKYIYLNLWSMSYRMLFWMKVHITRTFYLFWSSIKKWYMTIIARLDIIKPQGAITLYIQCILVYLYFRVAIYQGFCKMVDLRVKYIISYCSWKVFFTDCSGFIQFFYHIAFYSLKTLFI